MASMTCQQMDEEIARYMEKYGLEEVEINDTLKEEGCLVCKLNNTCRAFGQQNLTTKEE